MGNLQKKKTVKKKAKKKNGRPSKRDTINLNQLSILAEFGLTDKQLSKALGICETTLNKYKKDKKFLKSIKKGKKISDRKVVESLYKRATGFQYTERHIVNGVPEKIIQKIMAPETMACMYWLNNRDPDNWRNTKYIESKNDNTNRNYDMTEMTDKEIDKKLKEYGKTKQKK